MRGGLVVGILPPWLALLVLAGCLCFVLFDLWRRHR
jgi:hypothetical protein